MSPPVRTLLVVLAFSISSAAHADCKRNASGVFEDIACAATTLDEANKELAFVLGQLGRELDAASVKSLNESQDAWTKYRAAEASFVYAREGNGSLGRLIVANNSERATRLRIQELRQWLKQK